MANNKDIANIFKIVSRLITSLGLKKTHDLLESLDKGDDEEIMIDKFYKQEFNLSLKDLQDNNIRSDNRTIALITCSRYLKMDLCYPVKKIAILLKKSEPSVRRYIRDFEKQDFLYEKINEYYNKLKQINN